MQIDYLDSRPFPMIRIYGDVVTSFVDLYGAFQKLASASVAFVPLHELPNFNGCHLTISIGEHSHGIYDLSGGNYDFQWVMNFERWKVVAELVEPFTEWSPYPSHQWLYGEEARLLPNTSKTSILLSNDPNGSW